MRVEVDDKSGFCFGVVNAISRVEECVVEAARRGAIGGEASVADAMERPLVSLGDIVHNGAEVARLEALGLEVVPEDEPLEHLAGRQVLIRAHGEPPSTYRKARKLGITLVDATCPVVAQLQKTACEAHSAMECVDGQVVIFGRRGHAEVRGLVGQGDGGGDEDGDGRAGNINGDEGAGDIDGVGARNRFVVVENEADLAGVDFSRPIYFLAQTTGSLDEFDRLGEEIRRRAGISCGYTEATNVTIHDTICRRVAGREKHLAEFAGRFDVVVFVTGAKSSNGRVLFEAVRAANPHSHKIEDASELRHEWFGLCEHDSSHTPEFLCAPDYSRDSVSPCAPGRAHASESHEISVGVCGATSTPRWLMNEIAEKIAEM